MNSKEQVCETNKRSQQHRRDDDSHCSLLHTRMASDVKPLDPLTTTAKPLHSLKNNCTPRLQPLPPNRVDRTSTSFDVQLDGGPLLFLCSPRPCIGIWLLVRGPALSIAGTCLPALMTVLAQR